MTDMTKPFDGGPAFPVETTATPYAPGMTLRDWFAGQAIRTHWGDGTAMTTEEAASMAYQLANAMLDFRANGGAQ